MKIYDIGHDTARRLKLLDGELGNVQENGYLFVCKEEEDTILIVEYIIEAISRGIEVFESATKDIITKVDNNEGTAIKHKFPVFTFVAGNVKDIAWIQGVIKRILEDEERHIAEKERHYGDDTSHSS